MTMFNKWMRRVAAGLLALSVAACGGGGGSAGEVTFGGGGSSGGGGGSGGGGTTPLTATVSVALSNSSVSDSAPATATITVRNAGGAAVSGALVNLTMRNNLGSLSVPSLLTDANGQGTLIVRPVSTNAVGADLLIATYTQGQTNFTGQAGFQVNGSAPAAMTISVGSSTLRPGSLTPVTATVRTSAGAAVAGALVQFSSLQSRAILSVDSALTDSNGQAVVTATVAAGASGADTITARAQVTGAELSASINVQAGAAAQGSLSLSLPDELGTGQSVPAVATLLDANGAPVRGVIVAFRSLNGVATTDRPTDITGSAGTATANVQKSNPNSIGADLIEAKATLNGVDLIASRAIRVTTVSASAARIVVTTPSQPVTSASGGEAIVTVLRADGTPVAGSLVALSTSQGIGRPTRPTDLTDSSGQIRVQLVAASGTATGADELIATATIDGVSVTSRSPFRVNAIAAGQIALQLLDANGNAVSTVTSGSPARVVARVTNESGVPVPSVVVSFRTLLGFGGFSSPTALTNGGGEASVQLRPVTSQTSGADTVVASATLNGATLTTNQGFQLTATNVSISGATTNPSTVSAYGQADIIVSLAGTSPTEPVVVSLTSTCIGENKASATPSTVTTTTGTARFTYRDNGCGAVRTQDAIQLSVNGTASSQSAQLGLTSPTVSAINFTSATPSTIFLRGSGYTENSTIRFQVKDANGNGMPAQCAAFELSTLAGGLLLEDQTGSVRRKSDANGDFFVRVNSGTVPTPVRVRATLVTGANANDCSGGTVSNIATVSSNLSVAVGLPSQLNFSLAQGTINIEGYDRDGEPNTYTITASDRTGNPVPEGTAINFVTEGGQIQASRFTSLDANGLSRTTANFISAQPKPLDGRITVLAYALGEKSFLDTNGNNQYDSFEFFQDLADVFLDRLFNASYNSSNQLIGGYNSVEDQIISLTLPNSTLGFCFTPLSGANLLQLDRSIPSLSMGQRCSVTIKPDGTTDLRAYVRRAVETVLSRSTARASWGNRLPAGSYVPASASCPLPRSLRTGYGSLDTPITVNSFDAGSTELYAVPIGGSLSFISSDSNPVAFNPLPAGTVISASGSDGLSVSIASGTPVASSSQPQGATLNYKFADNQFSGTVTVQFRTPSGTVSGFNQFLSRSSAPVGYTACP